MDFTSLKAILDTHISGAKLTLPSSVLESDTLNVLFGKYLVASELVVENITARNESEAEASVTIVGTGAGLPFEGLTVEARFSAGGGQAELFLSASFVPGSADAVWTLDRSFASLRNSVIPSLHFVAPTALFLASYEVSDTIKSGMTFNGTMQSTSGLARFSYLLGDQRQTLSGQIDMSNGIPVMLLSGPAGGEKEIGFFTFPQVILEVHCDPRYSTRVNSYLPEVYVSFNTTIDFQAQGETRQIPVRAALYNPENDIQFDADLTDGLDAALDELASLANGIGLRNVLPPDLNLEEFLKLTGVGVQVNPSAQNKLVAAKFQVETVQTWPIVRDGSGRPIITLGGIKLLFSLKAPFGSGNLGFALTGEVGIGSEGVLEVGANYPGFAFSGALKTGTTINVKEIFEQILGASDNRIPDLTVTEFELSVQPSVSFAFDIDLDGQWVIPLGGVTLTVEEITLSVEQQQGQSTSSSFGGTFKFANYEFTVKADHPDANQGWTFKGNTTPGEALPIGYLLADIAFYFNIEVPDFVYDITLENITLSFNTMTKDFSFTCEGKFPVDGKEVDIVVIITLTHSGGNFTKDLSGKLTVGALEFDLHFSADNTSNFFAAVYKQTAGQPSLKLKELVNYVSSSVADAIPESLELDLKDVLFAFGKDSAGTKFLFGLDIGTGINLSNLPLVGQEFPADMTIGVNDLQLLVASKALTRSEVNALNNLIPVGVKKLPVPQATTPPGSTGDTPAPATPPGSTGTTSAPATPPSSTGTTSAPAIDTSVALAAGLTMSATMNFGGSPATLALPVAGAGAPGSATTPAIPPGTTAPPAAIDPAKWFMLQKAFGPVYFDKVGVQYQDATLWFLLNASLSALGLTLSLDGLSVGSPLTKFDPQFNLRGIGVGYKNGAVEISAAFLRKKVTTGTTTYDEYDGAALIKTAQLTLSAIGSYAKLDGHPSMFIYAVLDYPIGGPSFFFITGLAAGFGFNRALVAPAIDQVARFPFVAEAVAGAGMPTDLTRELETLRQYVPPQVGEYFLAVGIKFTSFKMVDSFALLMVAFGQRLEINVLGLSTMIVPTPIPGQTAVPPLAQVQMALKASYIPDQGFLGVTAQLTTASFLFSRNCHLTGGFAFWSWLSGPHAGDFVLTLGGYHPSYVVPAHYPKVPRLGFNWLVDPKISIKGEFYFALTAATFMAGGHLQATWVSGDIKAWFNAGADFIIAWKPYHYEATMSVDLSVSYTYQAAGTHTLKADVGADLQLWGPEFSGKAHIKLSIISFNINFGSDSSPKPRPIDWNTFKTSFLPKDDQVCGVAIRDGLLKDSTEGWIVNPKGFTLTTNAVIPSKEADTGSTVLAAGYETNFGIGSMAVKAKDLVTRQTITILRDQEPANHLFAFVPIKKNVPAGLWGQSLVPSLKGQDFIKNTLAGFEIKPMAQPAPGVTAPIEPGVLQYSTERVDDVFSWESIAQFTAGPEAASEWKQTISNSLTDPATVNARAELLRALGITAAITAGGETANAFLGAPQIGSIAG